MREVDHRSSSHRSRHTSRSKSRDRDRDRDRDYYSRRRRSKSRSRASKSKKKKSKKKRYRRSSSSSSASSKTSSRSRGSIKSSGSSIRRTTQPPSCEDNSSSIQPSKEISLHPIDIPERSTIEKIEEDTFTAKPFVSTAESKKITEKVIIDLKNDTISVETKTEDSQPEQSLIFHSNFLGDDMRKMEKWIKKLYNYRQKAFQE